MEPPRARQGKKFCETNGGGEGERTWKRGGSREEARDTESGFGACILKPSNGTSQLLGK